MKALKDEDIIVVGDTAANILMQLIQTFEADGICGEWEVKTTPEGIYIFIAPDDVEPGMAKRLNFRLQYIMDRLATPYSNNPTFLIKSTEHYDEKGGKQ